MRTYTVKEIAEMLKTNPETVRRWIRSGRLEATQDSRKEGNLVTEQMLQAFLKESPKYAAMLAPILITPIGMTAATAAVTGSLLASKMIKADKQQKQATVDSDEMLRFLKLDATKLTMSVKRKREAITQLQKEIDEDLKQLEEIKTLIKELE